MTDEAKSDVSMSSADPSKLMVDGEGGVAAKTDEVTALQDSIGART